jgi:hypothetical protein
MEEHRCQRCGKRCDEWSFFTLRSGRVWMHMECILDAAKEIIESRRADDVRAAMKKWPDGVTEIISSKKLRNKKG